MTQSRPARVPMFDRMRRQAGEAPASERLLFFRQFLANPKAVGSIIPTSQAAIRATLAPVDWERCRTFVEYGPGTGVFTRAVLERAHPDALVIAIDPNPEFIALLNQSLPDPRLRAVRGSAESVAEILAAEGRSAADYILSGLPFSTLPPPLAEAIVAATAGALAPGGSFLVYQYSLFVKPLLDAHFDRVHVGRVWRCIPPARLMFATKNGAEPTES